MYEITQIFVSDEKEIILKCILRLIFIAKNAVN